jgi:hypothetical protein
MSGTAYGSRPIRKVTTRNKLVNKLELFRDSVFLVGIGWYFLGILPTDTKEKLGWYILIL